MNNKKESKPRSDSKDNKNSLFMSLYREEHTDECHAFVNKLAKMVHENQSRKRGITEKLRQTVAAIIADLLEVAALGPPDAYAFRSTMTKTFTDCPIGHKPFTETIATMKALGLVEVEMGYRESTLPNAKRTGSTYKPTAALLKLAAEHGIMPRDHHLHFRYRKPRPHLKRPIDLRKASTKAFGRYGDKIRGESIAFDLLNPIAVRHAEQVNRIHAFLAQQKYENCTYTGFRRIFSDGDKGGHNFDKGGRLYANEPSYQAISSKFDLDKPERILRAEILINGEETRELDVKCSHVNIYRHLNGIVFNPIDDAYDILGLPRNIVKMFVTQLLGSPNIPRRWSSDQKERYRRDCKKLDQLNENAQLQSDYPIGSVSQTVIKALPFLSDWNTNPIRWGDLQYIESVAIIAAVERLAELRIPALPVHDSLIVPVSKANVARTVMQDMFETHIGFKPHIT